MDGRKFVVGTVTGGVVYFFLGFLFYAVLLQDFFMANQGSATGVPNLDMQYWPLIIGNIAHAALLTYIFNNWANIGSAKGGFKAGALVGFFMTTGFDLILYDTTNMMTLTAAIADIVVYTVISGIAGAIIALVAGSAKEDAG